MREGQNRDKIRKATERPVDLSLILCCRGNFSDKINDTKFQYYPFGQFLFSFFSVNINKNVSENLQPPERVWISDISGENRKDSKEF